MKYRHLLSDGRFFGFTVWYKLCLISRNNFTQLMMKIVLCIFTVLVAGLPETII